MIGILIVSHGRLADALISSVQSLVGNLPRVSGVSIWPKDREKEIKNKIQHKMAEVDDGDGVVILTDIFGGTPTNASLSLSENDKVQVVTGVNMPMLLTLSSYRQGKSLMEIAKLVKKSGRRSITLAKKTIRSMALKREGKGRVSFANPKAEYSRLKPMTIQLQDYGETNRRENTRGSWRTE